MVWFEPASNRLKIIEMLLKRGLYISDVFYHHIFLARDVEPFGPIETNLMI